MHVRRARESDSAILLAWRNDPQTRANSLRQATVREEEHETWFSTILDSPRTEIWVGEIGGVPVGQVRLDLEDPSVAVVDIAVAPDRRGHGVGGQLLRLVLERQSLGPQRLRAEVRHENAASKALFASAGFTPVDTTADCTVLERRLVDDDAQLRNCAG